MSTISTTANYGGRIDTVQGNIKQFITSNGNTANWIFKRPNVSYQSILVQTPENPYVPVLIENNLTVTGNLTVYGSIFNPSDERLKENINNIHLEKANQLLTLQPITFQYNSDPKKNLHYGLSAQEVELLFPELISQTSNGYKTVNYQELIPIMLTKIKEMQEQIDHLKSIINC